MFHVKHLNNFIQNRYLKLIIKVLKFYKSNCRNISFIDRMIITFLLITMDKKKAGLNENKPNKKVL